MRQFSERGTEVAAYDYAHHNEVLLGNRSLILCLNQDAQANARLPMLRHSFGRFASRFELIELASIADIQAVIETRAVDVFYTQTPGHKDICELDNKRIYGACRTVKHCVFDYSCPESDRHSGISRVLNARFGTDIPVVPYMVDLPDETSSLRAELDIPDGALVFGRYGGASQFDISFVHECIESFLWDANDAYFLFMNTNKFLDHPRVIHLERELDRRRKVKFINTCDAMLHARAMGETFGAAVAEFSSKNKPVITCRSGDLEHLEILGDKAIVYNDGEELLGILKNARALAASRDDWNAYRRFTPQRVMETFRKQFLDD